MRSIDLYNAICAVDDDILERSEVTSYDHKKHEAAMFRIPKRRLPAALIAAILALLLMGAGVATIIYGDSIQNWFSHYWEAVTGQRMTESQTTVIDHLSQKIGISQTVDEVTVTVDSATVGDDNFFLLLRVDGLKFSDRYSYGFSSIDMDVKPDPLEGIGGIGGYGFQYHGLDGDGAVLLLIEYAYASRIGYKQNLSPIDITLTLENLAKNPHIDKEKTLVEGQWSFHFSLDRSNLPETIYLPDTEVMVMDLDKQELAPVTIKNIELTSTGLRFQYDRGEERLDVKQISVMLNNGASIEGGGGAGTPSENGATWNFSHYWPVPVNLDEVSAIRIGETEIIIP